MEQENLEEVWQSAFADENQVEKVETQNEIVGDSLSEDLSILINFGRLTSTFDFWGHRFVIKTLKMNEELQASNLAAQYSENLDQGTRAFVAAIVAAAIDSVDGIPIVSPLGPNDDGLVDRKFSYVLNNYYWVVVEHIYEQYAELLARVDLALEELKKK